MELFGKKKGGTPPGQPPASPPATTSDPRNDPNLIQVFDQFGREVFITKDQWRTNVLPGTLKSNWNDPEKLYGIIVGSLRDGFFQDILEAAKHLHEIDPVPSRGACIYAIALMKTSHPELAEHILQGYIEKHGEDGYVLTNLAKAYADQNHSAKADTTLWRALEVDPNQDNGLGWYLTIHRERNGKEGELEALCRVAALAGSWRAQLWLARVALESHDLSKALAYYKESLSRIASVVPADLLMQMSGDLGRQGYLAELVQLAGPLFVPEIHGLQVGNNLIKACLQLGQVESAVKVLEQLYALKRPDYKAQLSFWETEIAKARIASTTTAQPPLNVGLAAIEGPIWLKSSSPAAALFGLQSATIPVVSFLGSSAETGNKSDQIQVQLADASGRLSRALPLFLAEQVEFFCQAHSRVFVPWVQEAGGGFVVSGVAWSDQDAANYARMDQEQVKSIYIVTTHLKTQAEPWIIELRLIRVADGVCLDNLISHFPPAQPQKQILELARQLVAILVRHANFGTQKSSLYKVPEGNQFPYYLLRLEQMLAVRCSKMPGTLPSFLNSPREILDGNLELCLGCPNNVVVRILFAQTLSTMRRVRPELMPEFKEKVRLLQQKYPLHEPTHAIVQRMFDEALSVVALQ